jgi:hypothetical protein
MENRDCEPNAVVPETTNITEQKGGVIAKCHDNGQSCTSVKKYRIVGSSGGVPLTLSPELADAIQEAGGVDKYLHFDETVSRILDEALVKDPIQRKAVRDTLDRPGCGTIYTVIRNITGKRYGENGWEPQDPRYEALVEATEWASSDISERAAAGTWALAQIEAVKTTANFDVILNKMCDMYREGVLARHQKT